MKGSKILLIDDDNDDVEILADAFTRSGVDSVHYVHTVMDAFIYLQALPLNELPKLVITDLYLPGITGLEFLADLKTMEKYKQIHVIVLSTVKSNAEIERYKQMGAIDYVKKPSSYEEYLEVAQNIKSRLLA
ncbi:MAG: response regulator [Bacteroidota bacterium]|nr:response regulator [Bacteroidota bacterium]